MDWKFIDYMLKYDSLRKEFPGTTATTEVQIFHEKEPASIPCIDEDDVDDDDDDFDYDFDYDFIVFADFVHFDVFDYDFDYDFIVFAVFVHFDDFEYDFDYDFTVCDDFVNFDDFDRILIIISSLKRFCSFWLWFWLWFLPSNLL